MADLEGKSAIVTGAGKGLGQAIAESFAEAGARVVVSDIDGDAAEAVASGIDGSAFECDVTDPAQVEALVALCVEQHGGLDVMVPNAGVAGVGPLAEIGYEEWRRITSVNLDGVFLCVRYAVPAMIASGGGSIVNIASVTGIKSAPLVGPYAAAKAGVISLTRTAALEYRQHGVRVNCVAPGFVATDMVKNDLPRFNEATGVDLGEVLVQKQGRMGEPGDVASVVTWLASDRCTFTNGAPFVMDGGLTASLL